LNEPSGFNPDSDSLAEMIPEDFQNISNHKPMLEPQVNSTQPSVKKPETETFSTNIN